MITTRRKKLFTIECQTCLPVSMVFLNRHGHFWVSKGSLRYKFKLLKQSPHSVKVNLLAFFRLSWNGNNQLLMLQAHAPFFMLRGFLLKFWYAPNSYIILKRTPRTHFSSCWSTMIQNGVRTYWSAKFFILNFLGHKC